MHASWDPRLLSCYIVFGLCMAAMAVMVTGALFPGGEGIVIDRSVGMGGPFMLLFIAVDLIAVAIVWLYERRQRL